MSGIKNGITEAYYYSPLFALAYIGVGIAIVAIIYLLLRRVK